jgi:hypothetical protein
MPAVSSSAYLTPILLLIASNVFMTLAWYGHLRFKETPLITVIFVAWGIAFIEYCLRCRPTASAAPSTRPPNSRPSRGDHALVFAGFSVLYPQGTDHLELRDRLRTDRRRRVLRVSRPGLGRGSLMVNLSVHS